MKRKINLVIILMSICTISLLSVQLYWNYKSFYANKRIFKRQANEALNKSVIQLMDIRRDEFADQYRNWMLDTNLIKISVKYDDKKKANLFIMEDTKIHRNPRPPFEVLMSAFKERIDVLTPSLKKQLADVFVKDFLYGDFATGRILFFTTSLGEMQSKAFDTDRLDLKRLEKIYRNELSSSEVEAPFNFKVIKYQFTRFNQQQRDSLDTNYQTKSYMYGFGHKVMVSAVFSDVDLANLKSMKWLLFTSLILMTITVSCFAYTVKTMLSQEKLTELKDDFVNNMTHELKTPVATISIAAEAIQDFEMNKDSAHEYLGIIRYQSNNLAKLIDQILDKTLIEHNTIILKQQPIAFSEILTHCLNQFQPQLNQSVAILTVDVGAKNVRVFADENHLQSVLANLLDNAIKYSDGQPIINITTYEEHKSLHFEISNSSKEIPKEYLNKIFDKFFRIPTGNTHEVKGYGLGLSYVRDIIKKHGGQITVHNHDRLITFKLILPIYEFT